MESKDENRTDGQVKANKDNNIDEIDLTNQQDIDTILNGRLNHKPNQHLKKEGTNVQPEPFENLNEHGHSHGEYEDEIEESRQNDFILQNIYINEKIEETLDQDLDDDINEDDMVDMQQINGLTRSNLK